MRTLLILRYCCRLYDVLPGVPPAFSELGEEGFVIVPYVLHHGESDLPLVGKASGLPRLFARLGENRENYNSKNSDNCYHNKNSINVKSEFFQERLGFKVLLFLDT